MALIKKVCGKEPKFGNNFWAAETATIIGDVEMGENCTVWFNAVIRGDVNSIRMGNNVNIQDNAMVHCTYQQTTTDIGNNVSVAHNAIVHGCKIEDNVLIGMGAIVMDNAHIESNSVVAAGSVVLEGTHIESGSIWAGVPAKKVKQLDPEKFESLNMRIANSYTKYASWYTEEE